MKRIFCNVNLLYHVTGFRSAARYIFRCMFPHTGRIA